MLLIIDKRHSVPYNTHIYARKRRIFAKRRKKNNTAQWNWKLLPETVVTAIDERDLDDSPDYAFDQDPRAEALLQDPQYVRSVRLTRELDHIAFSRHYETLTREEGNPKTAPPFIDVLNEEIAFREELVAEWHESKRVVPYALDFELKRCYAVRGDYQKNHDIALHHLS